MDEINEQTENMKQIQDALSAPIGAAADFDEVCTEIFNNYEIHSLKTSFKLQVHCCRMS